MSTKEELIYKVEQGVARIIMNRPAQMNSMSHGLLQGIWEAFGEAARDDEVRCAVLSGTGEAFSAGGDMGVLKQWSQSSATVVYRHMKEVGEVVMRVYCFPKPLITAVNGVAVGGGCSLALCGDVILASERARFGMVFSRHNLGPDMGASFLLPRLVGVLRAKELLFSGRIISAQEAFSYGMVSQVVPDHELEARAMEMAHEMAAWAPQAICLGKALLQRSMAGADLGEMLELEAQAQAILFNSDDTREAIKAFLEKRKPVFRNR
ncbi:MAG: enoyl-CoA hydratase-related protein [bacterium]